MNCSTSFKSERKLTTSIRKKQFTMIRTENRAQEMEVIKRIVQTRIIHAKAQQLDRMRGMQKDLEGAAREIFRFVLAKHYVDGVEHGKHDEKCLRTQQGWQTDHQETDNRHTTP